MKKAVFIAVLALFAFFSSCSRKPKTSCVYGDKIPEEILEKAGKIGDEIMFALENKNFDEIYKYASQMMKKSQTKEQFKTVMKVMLRNFAPIEYPQLKEAYYLKNKAGKKYAVVSVPCSLTEKSNDIYQVPANSEIVSLIYYSRSGEEIARTFIELIKEDNSWKLLSIALSPRTFLGNTVANYIKKARKAREEGKLRLAILYYRLASLLADISPNVDEYVSRMVTQEMAQIKVDYMPMGMAEYWKVDDTIFRVFRVDVFIDKNQPWVKINWIADNFDNLDEVKELSQKLLDFAINKFPEYREFFVGIITEAVSEDPRYSKQTYRLVKKFPKKS